MLSEGEREEAAELVWRLWQEDRVVDEIPARLTPASREESYAVQSLYEKRSAKPLFGWKIAATSKAGQAHIGIDRPIAGRVLAERVHDGGALVDLGANRMRVAEPEFAFRFGHDLPTRAAPYEVNEILGAVASLHPAIELPDSRLTNFAKVGEFQLIVDDACARDFVLGPPATADWRRLDLARYPVHAVVAGKLERDGSGSNVLGDPRVALAWLVNELSSLGVTLKAGQVVTTGTCMTPLPIGPGDAVHADFGILGSVTVRFAVKAP
jgi:2-keto-4-pentenoate hydratase